MRWKARNGTSAVQGAFTTPYLWTCLHQWLGWFAQCCIWALVAYSLIEGSLFTGEQCSLSWIRSAPHHGFLWFLLSLEFFLRSLLQAIREVGAVLTITRHCIFQTSQNYRNSWGIIYSPSSSPKLPHHVISFPVGSMESLTARTRVLLHFTYEDSFPNMLLHRHLFLEAAYMFSCIAEQSSSIFAIQ